MCHTVGSFSNTWGIPPTCIMFIGCYPYLNPVRNDQQLVWKFLVTSTHRSQCLPQTTPGKYNLYGLSTRTVYPVTVMCRL